VTTVLASNAPASHDELPDGTTAVMQGTTRSNLIALSDTQLELSRHKRFHFEDINIASCLPGKKVTVGWCLQKNATH
jgi:hypothetical protein